MIDLPDAGLALLRGQSVEVELAEPLLLKQALWGYGLPLLGLLLGAAVLTPFGDVAAAIGAMFGISLAVAYSRRAAASLPSPQIRLAPEPTA